MYSNAGRSAPMPDHLALSKVVLNVRLSAVECDRLRALSLPINGVQGEGPSLSAKVRFIVKEFIRYSSGGGASNARGGQYEESRY